MHSSPEPPGAPIPRHRAPGSVYTFYSYKGGVGRSMALVNTGVLLALSGKRVLLVDWDLEAPGLEFYFQQEVSRLQGDPAQVPGVIDLLESRAAGPELDWRRCLLRAEFLSHSLDIISAGSRTEDYRARVQRLDWSTLYKDHAIGNFIDALRDQWRAEYDFVLVDSRTGITDIGDICTVLLPDALVLMFVSNYQNIAGVKSVMARAVAARKNLPTNRAKLLAVPLPARDEVNTEYDKTMSWRRIYAAELGDLYSQWLPKTVSAGDALNKLFIPYVTNWSFGERIPVLESTRETQDPTTIGAAYRRLANLLANDLDWYSLEEKVAVEDVQAAQTQLLHERERSSKLEQELAVAAKRSHHRQWILAGVFALLIAAFGFWYFYLKPAPVSTELIDGRQLYEAGKTEQALQVFEARTQLLTDRLKSAPNDPVILFDLDVAQIWRGDALARLGRSANALEAFRSGQTALLKAIEKKPDNQDWQGELAGIHARIGAVLEAQGKLDQALVSQRSYNEIVARLVKEAPSNSSFERELAVSHNKMGAVLEAQGKLDQALVSQRSYNEIMARLVKQDPSNTDFRRELAVSHSRIGGILEAQGKLDQALASFRSDVEISAKLAAERPSNAGFQVDLAIARYRVGRILGKQGKNPQALAEFDQSKALLLKLDVGKICDKDCQLYLIGNSRRISETRFAEHDSRALDAANEAVDRYKKIKIEPGSENFWQPEGARVLMERAQILAAGGDSYAATRDLDEAATMIDRLLKVYPEHFEWRQDAQRLSELRSALKR